MCNGLNEKIWIQMKQAKGLSEDDREIYLFGFTQGAILLLNILTSLCIGTALDMILEVFVYMVCFIPLRIFAGGYHAKTQLRCYIMSSFATVFVLLGIRFLQDYNGTLEWIMLLISTAVIWKLAPVEDANKPLAVTEILEYKARVHKMLLILLIVLGGFVWQKNWVVVSVIMCSFYFLTMILLIGLLAKVKLKIVSKCK